jgi:hypothetical protein
MGTAPMDTTSPSLLSTTSPIHCRKSLMEARWRLGRRWRKPCWKLHKPLLRLVGSKWTSLGRLWYLYWRYGISCGAQMWGILEQS